MDVDLDFVFMPKSLFFQEEGEEEALEAEILERLIRRPEDITSHVTDNIQKYKSNMLTILEVGYHHR